DGRVDDRPAGRAPELHVPVAAVDGVAGRPAAGGGVDRRGARQSAGVLRRPPEARLLRRLPRRRPGLHRQGRLRARADEGVRRRVGQEGLHRLRRVEEDLDRGHEALTRGASALKRRSQEALSRGTVRGERGQEGSLRRARPPPAGRACRVVPGFPPNARVTLLPGETSTTTASSAVVLAGGRSPAGLPASVTGSRVPRLVRGAGGAGAHSSHANTPVESGRRPTRTRGRGHFLRQTTQASPRSWAVVSPPGSTVGSPAWPMS